MADISQIELQSNFFAQLVKDNCFIEGLEYGIIYVKTNNDVDWITTMEKVKESFANSNMRSIWLMKFDLNILSDSCCFPIDSKVGRLVDADYNILMPIFIPDTSAQYFLVGKIEKPSQLELATALFTIDAQNLLKASIPDAFSLIDENVMEAMLLNLIEEGNIIEDIASLIGGGPSFRGMVAPNPMTFLGEAAVKVSDWVKKGRFSYKEKRAKIMQLPKIVKRMKEEDKKVRNEAAADFSMAWNSLSAHEQALLVNEMMKEIKPISLKRIVDSIANREELGINTKYKLTILPMLSEFKSKYGFDDYHKRCLFIRNENEIFPLKMAKKSTVIYTMSLIEKVTKAQKNFIVDVQKNNKAYVDIYQLMFNDFNKEIVQTGYKELFLRNAMNPNAPIRTGRLSEYYNDIEYALANAFKNLDEDYSPFMANLNTPLVITPEKIEIPEELKEIKIH